MPTPETDFVTDADAARKALNGVIDPASGKGLVDAGLVQGLVVRAGRAGFVLEVPAGEAVAYAPVRDAAEQALAALPGINAAQVVLTASTPAPGATRVRKGAKVADDPQTAMNGRRRRLCAPPMCAG